MNAMIDKPTKAVSKRQARARKRERRTITLANGETATAPIGQGQRKAPEDARKTAAQARVRVFGMTGADADRAALNPLCGSGVGQCIIALAEDQAATKDTWNRLCAAQHNYRTRILGLSGNPQGSAIAMQPDAMQADTGHTIDIRSADEKDEGAKRAWANAEASINALPVPQWKWAIRSAMDGGIDGMGGDVWRDGQPTSRGKVLVQALVALGVKRTKD